MGPTKADASGLRARLDDIRQFDYHWHWEKDEWYPEGGFLEAGSRERCPLELFAHDYAGTVLVQDADFPYANQWDWVGAILADEAAAWDQAQPFVEKHFDHVYIQTLLRGFELLHGVAPGEFVRDYAELSRRVRAAYAKGLLAWLPTAYERGRLLRSVNIWTTRYATHHFDRQSKADQQRELDLMPPTFRFDYFLVLLFRLRQRDVAKWTLEALQDVAGEQVEPPRDPLHQGERYAEQARQRLAGWSFDDYLRYMDNIFEFFASRGARNLKSACCYKRSMAFHERSEADARRAFGRLVDRVIEAGEPAEDHAEDLAAFEDFAFFRAVQLARQRGWTFVQIHTGHTWRNEQEARPILLDELIGHFPDVTFAPLHGGKRFYEDVVELANRHENVVLDFTWLPIVAPELGAAAVRRFLETHPYRTAAGLDMANVEGSAGMSDRLRDLLADLLGERVAAGEMDADTAVGIARSVLHDVPRRAFGWDGSDQA